MRRPKVREKIFAHFHFAFGGVFVHARNFGGRRIIVENIFDFSEARKNFRVKFFARIFIQVDRANCIENKLCLCGRFFLEAAAQSKYKENKECQKCALAKILQMPRRIIEIIFATQFIRFHLPTFFCTRQADFSRRRPIRDIADLCRASRPKEFLKRDSACTIFCRQAKHTMGILLCSWC